MYVSPYLYILPSAPSHFTSPGETSQHISAHNTENPEYKKPEAKKNGRDFTIQRMEAHVWSVDAPWLEYILAGSNVDDYESLQFFQRQLGESGILDALVQKGVEENDTILIGEYQFDYIF